MNRHRTLGLAGLALATALASSARADSGSWDGLSQPVQAYLQDRFRQSTSTWAEYDDELRAWMLAAATRNCGARAEQARRIAARARQARAYADWERAEFQRREALLDAAALSLWVPDGVDLGRRLRGFRLYRAHAALGELTGADEDWAAKNLAPAEARRLLLAQKSGRAALADALLGDSAQISIEPPPLLEPTHRVQLKERSLEAQSFLNSALDKLARSATGRRIMDEVVKSYEAAGRRPLVYLGPSTDFRGTKLVRRSGYQDIEGGSIEAADPAQGMALVNPAFLRLRDRDLATEEAAASLAHEFEHLRLSAAVSRALPNYAEAFRWDLTGERSARLAGWTAALELRARRARPTMEAGELTAFARDPDRYWKGLKGGSAYVTKLDLFDLSNPLGAYETRLAAVESRLKEPGLSPERAADYRVRKAKLLRRLSFLRAAKGRALLREELAASQDPAYRAFFASTLREEQTLWRLYLRTPVPLVGSSPTGL